MYKKNYRVKRFLAEKVRSKCFWHFCPYTSASTVRIRNQLALKEAT